MRERELILSVSLVGESLISTFALQGSLPPYREEKGDERSTREKGE